MPTRTGKNSSSAIHCLVRGRQRSSVPRFAVVVAVLIAVGTPLTAQQEITVIDSIAVSGNERNTRGAILATAGIATGEPISFRDVQRGIDAPLLSLMKSGVFYLFFSKN